MTLNSILKWAVIVGLVLVIIIPIMPGVAVAVNLFFPFITGKNFAFRIIVDLIFGLWLILAFRSDNYRPKFSWLLAAVFIFLGVMLVADIFSAYSFKSFWSNYERMEGFVTIAHLAAYFLVASSVLNTEKFWLRFLQTNLGVSFIVGIYGILQLAGKIAINQGALRIDGPFGNAAYMAAYMLMNFFIALFLFIKYRKAVIVRYLYILLMLLQLFIVYKTETRGAALGLLGGILISAVIVALFSRGWNLYRKIAVGMIVVVTVVAGGTFLLKNTDFVKNSSSLNRLTSISLGDAGPRFMVWTMAWHGLTESPKTMLIGWGQESFNYVFNKYYIPQMYSQEQWFDRAHDIVFDWLIAGGIFGLASYLFVLLAALYNVWKQGQSDFSYKKCLSMFAFWRIKEEVPYLAEKSVLTGLFAAYFFQNIFVFDNITSYIVLFTVLAYINFVSGRPMEKISQLIGKIEPGTINRVIVPAIGVLTVLLVYLVNANPLRASLTLIDALRSQPEGVGKNLDLFKQALAYDSFGNPEIREQLTQAAVQIINASSVDLQTKQAYYNLTYSELKKQITLTPKDARYLLFFGSFLNRSHNYDEAITYLNKALEYSPKKQTIMFELGSAYLNKGDMTDALAVMKKAYDLEPDFSEARIIYAVTAVYAKQFDLANQLITPLAGTSSAHDDRLIQAYTSGGQWNKVITLTKLKVADNPTDSQLLFSLAAAYLKSGDRATAITTLLQAEKVNLSVKDQAEYYIKEIRAGRNP